MKRLASAAVLLAATSAGLALAAGPKPEQEIEYRQAVMTVIGRAMGPMGAMAQGKAPYDAAVVKKNSALIDTLLGLPFHSFGPGTDKGRPTKADPKIWKEMAKFNESADQAQKAAAELAATGGEEAKFKAAFGKLGKSCKGCHDDFRMKEARG